jgi:hypothetical protein
MRRSLVLAAVVALALAAQASATVVHWNEAATIDKAKVMTYRVSSLTVGSKSWSAQVAFANTSHQTLKVGSDFGIAFFAKRSQSALADAVGFAFATSGSSKLPTTMKPGESWSGTISGKGKLTLTTTLYARVVFGPFTGLPGESNSVDWITNHELPVAPPPAPGNIA